MIDIISTMMSIEGYCVRGARSLAEGYSYHDLRNRYPADYYLIRTELDPEYPKKEAELQAEEARKCEELDHEAALIARLAKAEISEEAFNQAMRYLERKNELEGMR